MTQEATTVADIHAASTDTLINEWCYSDAHKAVFGFRPRGSFTREEVVHFWINFPRYWEEMEAEEEAALHHKRAKHGINFATMSEYYSWWEKTEWDRHCAAMEAEMAAEELARQKAADYKVRRKTIDVVREFEHGFFKGAIA